MNINLSKTVMFYFSSFFIMEEKAKVWMLITSSKGVRTQLFVRMLCNHSHISTSLAE